MMMSPYYAGGLGIPYGMNMMGGECRGGWTRVESEADDRLRNGNVSRHDGLWNGRLWRISLWNDGE